MNKFQYLVGNQTRSVIHSSSLFFFYIWNKLAWEAKTIILLRDWAPDFQASRLMWFIGFSWSFAVVEDKKPAWVSFQPPPTPNAIHSVFSPNHRLRVVLYAINCDERESKERVRVKTRRIFHSRFFFAEANISLEFRVGKARLENATILSVPLAECFTLSSSNDGKKSRSVPSFALQHHLKSEKNTRIFRKKTHKIRRKSRENSM